jgi:RIO kinase 1
LFDNETFDPFAPARPAPDWLITEYFEDTDLGVLKTGKEADVSLVERRSQGNDGRTLLLARKRYRPRSVRKGELEALGFTKAGSFRNDIVYRDGRKYAKSRDQRAVTRMTNYGKELVKQRWTGHEFEMMRRAWDASVPVPYPVESGDDGFLMQYLGDDDGAAPRLVQARLSRDQAEQAFAELIDAVGALAAGGVVHADLSPYNVLWWDNQSWLIDFPQAVEFGSPHSEEFLRRDITNICRWYERHTTGPRPDPGAIFALVITSASRH